MSEEKTKVSDIAAEEEELDLGQLDQVSGGSIGSARKEKTKPLDPGIAGRYSN